MSVLVRTAGDGSGRAASLAVSGARGGGRSPEGRAWTVAGTKGSLEAGSGLVGVGEPCSRELAGGVDNLPPHVVSTGVGRQLCKNPPPPTARVLPFWSSPADRSLG